MFNLSAFTPHIGQTFEVDVDAPASFPLVLLEAKAMPDRPGPGREAPFQLRFRSTGPMMLLQGTYRLSCSGLDEMDLFLVPIGAEEGSFVYQAIFN